ncbi:hypothetical protein GWI33_017382 [Rhynchophorus ferrugineus]|uniref:Reverse transcriptase Ty1/copia-type domain-containing protein n=1 Tax=Rhynchophorus ferrugineus TaxID=354439 RepID=A0A834HW33_RHYFE|nr:hypothetical protein GWI33_017382 [Rhynchophorus ferrugineus]
MHLAQFDISTAFLYGELEETIYMMPLSGCNAGTDRICQLKRSLYGLKQAARCWNKRIGSFLIELGFSVSEADPYLYVRSEHGRELFIVLYMDVGLVAATNHTDLEFFCRQLKT